MYFLPYLNVTPTWSYEDDSYERTQKGLKLLNSNKFFGKTESWHSNNLTTFWSKKIEGRQEVDYVRESGPPINFDA